MPFDDRHRALYAEEARELLGELEASLLELEERKDDEELVGRVFRALHTIKGSGAMFGFDDIAHFTHDVENAFDLVREGRVKVCKTLLDLTFQAKDVIQVLLEAGVAGNHPDLAPGDALAQRFREFAQGAPPQPESAAPPPGAAPAPRSSLPVAWRIRFRPRPDILFTGARPLALLAELAQLGELRAFPYVKELPRLEELDPEQVRIWWDIVLRTSASERELHDVFLFVEEDADISIRMLDGPQAGDQDSDDAHLKLGQILLDRGDILPEDLDMVLARRKPLGELLADQGMVTHEQVQSALAEQQLVRQSREERKAGVDKQPEAASIRVAASKLDYLVDLVGEMVIVQARVSQVVQDRKDPVLLSLSEELERLCDDLRGATLGIRMLPIGATFSKFRRLVRDLSEELGKEIDLVTQGEDTELDKTVIERLGDPLVHLLRNSIDHGIELPADRLAKGKPRRGTIQLIAEHSGGEVHIRITDDGKGIDHARVRQKAVERGLIAADADMTEREIANLIFLPGFSTAAAVTNVSGRGVGMDVVKRSIEALRGAVEILSCQGQGTCIRVKLPLTLAIIDGLQVRVGDDFFVIPLTNVEECVELPRRREDSRERIVNLRGQIVPYIRLRDWFEIEGAPPAIEQIVVAVAGEQRVGIVVDHVIGELQTVIKSLGRVFRDVQGISGATIKGDGAMALILDVPQLLHAVINQEA